MEGGGTSRCKATTRLIFELIMSIISVYIFCCFFLYVYEKIYIFQLNVIFIHLILTIALKINYPN